MKDKIYLSPEHLQRLQTVIEDLEHLPPEQFDFGVVQKYGHIEPCGCVVRHTIKLFPDFGYEKIQGFGAINSRLGIGIQFEHFDQIAERILNIPRPIGIELLQPNGQDRVHPELPMCDSSSFPSEVAFMLRKFIELCVTNEQPIQPSIENV